ncbi:MAG: class I SAM-dependent methyltransferase [Acidimicrobiia bacterium]
MSAGAPAGTVAPIANVEMAAAWEEEGERWAASAARYEAAGHRFWEALLAAAPVAEDHTVLDVGCGTGRSSRDLARRAAAGSVLGVDLSARMLERARAAADAEGLANVTFEQADAQVHPFPDCTYDLAVSVFGAMFFADPVAAFANIGRALAGDGRLALLAWRELRSNPWITVLRDALALGRELPEPPAGAPGPFGLADPRRTERVLTGAGFVAVELRPVDEPVRLGDDADDAYAFVSTMGMTKGLTADLDEPDRARALDSLREALARHESPDGVLVGASAWLVTAVPGPRLVQ